MIQGQPKSLKIAVELELQNRGLSREMVKIAVYRGKWQKTRFCTYRDKFLPLMTASQVSAEVRSAYMSLDSLWSSVVVYLSLEFARVQRTYVTFWLL